MFRRIGIDADTIVDDIQIGSIHVQAQATLQRHLGIAGQLLIVTQGVLTQVGDDLL